MRPNHAQAPRAAAAAPEVRLLRSVHPPTPHGDGLDPGALADLVAAPGTDVAGRARAALSPLLAHDALVLVTPASSGFPVQIAAPRGLRVGLAAIEWGRMTGGATTAEGTVARLPLPPIECGLDIAAWVAVSGRLTVALVVLAQGKLELDPEGEDAAMMVAMLAAARARRIDGDPPPGTLAFARSVSQERERVRAELNGRHAATLSSVLQTLRGGAWERSTPPAVTEAIDLASRALLDVDALNAPVDESGRIALRAAFTEAETEVRGIVHAARLRVLADLEGGDEVQVPRALAHAARIVTTAAALRAARRPGADKLRVLWRLTPTQLTVTVADNAALDAAEPPDTLAGVERRLGGLGAQLELDSRPHWGTTLICRLPLHDVAAAPESAAERRLAELRDREREVLELMITGLRNREIAERLFISVRTVKFHVSNILQKLDVDSRTAAIAVAHAAGVTAREPVGDVAVTS